MELLSWSYQYGKPERIDMFEKLRKKGKKTPLDEFPELDIFEMWYYNLYVKLSGQRSFNGYILPSEVISYCQMTTLIDPLEIVVNTILDIDMEFTNERHRDQANDRQPSGEE